MVAELLFSFLLRLSEREMGCVSGTHSSFPEHIQLNELLFICSCLSSLHLLFSATPEWRNSRISIPIADRTHSGIYSCSLLNTTLTVVNVQVLNGEFNWTNLSGGCTCFQCVFLNNTQILSFSPLARRNAGRSSAQF